MDHGVKGETNGNEKMMLVFLSGHAFTFVLIVTPEMFRTARIFTA